MTRAAVRSYQSLLVGTVVLAGLYLTSRHSYLLFHSIAETFSVVVAASIFVIAWNARHLYDNTYLLLIGIASFFLAGLGLLHMFAYKGVGLFAGYDANLPTQLWIATRGMEAITFLIAPVVVGKRLRADLTFALYALITALVLASIFVWPIFPTCYVDRPGGGLTPFKIMGEYLICLALFICLVLLRLRQGDFDPQVLRLLAGSLALAIAAELAFTQYVSVYGPANLVGHLLKIISLYFLYRAIVLTALVRPLDLLFRDLKRHAQQLRASQQMQEQMTQFLVHDLRSSLTGVQTGVTMLRDGARAHLDETERGLLDGAIAASSWLLTLTNALLDTWHLESGEMRLRLAGQAPGELVAAAWEQVSLWARLGRVRLQTEVEPLAPSVLVDRDLTIRVLVNLLSNAIGYSPAGSAVTVRVASHGHNQVAFSVTDQGPGIPPEWREKVFDRFASVEARQAGIASTGLGLSFCRLAVEAQGGRVSLTSELGKGSTATLVLPAAPPAGSV